SFKVVSLVFRNGEATVSAGAERMSPSLVNTWPLVVLAARAALMPSGPLIRNCRAAALVYGSMIKGVRVFCAGLVAAMTPSKIAAQAAKLVWLMDNCPRVALSLIAAVNRSKMAQSLVGCEIAASLTNIFPDHRRPFPVQFCHLIGDTGVGFM